jgi:Domain of unknown function (DUF4265)
MVKIKVPLERDNFAGADSESFWAEPAGDGLYKLRNVPFYAKGLSYDDLVEVQSDGADLIFKRVVKHNGHSTYRIYAKQGRTASEVSAFLDKLGAMNCDVEPATDKLVAIDVRPEADVYAIYSALTDAERAGIIDFQEGHCGHPLGRESF